MRFSYKKEPDLVNWEGFLKKLKNPKQEVNLALVGKYVELQDAYKSISEAFVHAGAMNECKVKVKWISSEEITSKNAKKILGEVHGLLVAPGFGGRGIEGKIEAIRIARENDIPFFGICLGMQCACIEFARNVLGLKEADSREMNDKVSDPIIDIMEDQKDITEMGGTMRLGAYDCEIKDGSRAFEIYGQTNITERHRHRYEFNSDYIEEFEKHGMIASGINPQTQLAEIVEIKDHRWFVGTQFHPELKSTVLEPHPLFVHFVKAALDYKKDLSKN